jgi:hypothetical protein
MEDRRPTGKRRPMGERRLMGSEAILVGMSRKRLYVDMMDVLVIRRRHNAVELYYIVPQ